MELRQGYKQTEVGIIPDDWKAVILGNVIRLQRGFDLPHRLRRAGKIPIISSSGICGLHDQPQAVAPGVVTGRYGTIGEVFFIEEDFWPLNTALFVKDFKGNDPRFISFLLRTIDFHSHSGKSGVPGVNRNDLHELTVALPTYKEQCAIAIALSDVDALIELLDKRIAKKRNIKQGAMQQLLTGKKRLPGYSGEWKGKRLGDVVEIVSGGTPKTGVSAYWDGDIKWCTPTDITGTAGKYLSETARTISVVGLANCSARLLPAGALLLCSRATIGEIKIATGAICTNQGFKSLICGKDVSNEYLYYLLLTMKAQIVEKAIGSTFLEISKKDTFLLEVSLPPIDEQTAIATVLSDMDAEIAAIVARRDKTKVIKQGMMQALLTGRIRLI